MIPELVELPSIKTVGNPRIVKPGLPEMVQANTMSSGRQQEAEAYAAAMGQAFAINRIQNRRQQAKARARGRQAQSAAEKHTKGAKKRGSASGRIDRDNFYRTARSQARMMGIGPELFKKAKL